VAGEPSVETSVDYCSGCGICTQVCPQGVKIAEINAQARNKLKRQKGVPLRDRIITRPTWLGRAGRRRRRSPTWTIDLPAAADPRREAAQGPSRRAGARLRRAALLALGAQAREPAHGRKFVYFHGCGTEYYEPEEGEKVVAILEHNGFEVEVPKQDCCGLPLQSSGLFDDARKVVLRLARNLRPHVRDDDTIIVGNATSCTLMLKREAREILDLEDDPDLKLGQRAHLRHLRAAARAPRPRRAEDRLPAVPGHDRLPRAVPAAGPLDRQAGAGAARADPGLR
jgi:glycerol-3-phosphate dehydrogenase subunit C